jgi:hypothetical protein
MRDIAQSFLDTQDLLAPGDNGADGTATDDAANGAGETPLAR